MPQAFEKCPDVHLRPSDSLSSMCWPITRQIQPVMLTEQSAFSHEPRNMRQEASWPMAEPWRRNLGQPRCGGEGRCQGDARRCNSKYRYGLDDVGQCPSKTSCKESYTCAQNAACVNPCAEAPDCYRRTSRCFEWPQPQRDKCSNEDTNTDFRPPRANLNLADDQPERCPTCKRVVVDMQCGPLGYNY